MAQHKLYTEEQVKEVVRLSLEDAEKSVIWSKEWYPQKLTDKILQSLQPIELPSDEEIGIARDENIPIDQEDMWSERFYFTVGAKWLRDKILNK